MPIRTAGKRGSADTWPSIARPQVTAELGVGNTSMKASPICLTTWPSRSEEHTSELQSLTNLVCRLLLEKKKKKNNITDRKKNIDRLSQVSSDVKSRARER